MLDKDFYFLVSQMRRAQKEWRDDGHSKKTMERVLSLERQVDAALRDQTAKSNRLPGFQDENG